MAYIGMAYKAVAYIGVRALVAGPVRSGHGHGRGRARRT